MQFLIFLICVNILKCATQHKQKKHILWNIKFCQVYEACVSFMMNSYFIWCIYIGIKGVELIVRRHQDEGSYIWSYFRHWEAKNSKS